MVKQRARTAAKWLAAGFGLAASVYAALAAVTWIRYGTPRSPTPEETDDLLDRFMPIYDVVERHHIRVEAPAAVTLAAAKEMVLAEVPAIRVIFRARELLLGASPDNFEAQRGILEETRALGWVVLADIPDREIVVGAVTKPWEADVSFRSIPPDVFAAFDEPDYVKIVWTLRADAIGASTSIFRTETRAVATDAQSRRKFRRYWSFLSPGISLIRRLSLAPVKREAEDRGRLGSGLTDQ